MHPRRKVPPRVCEERARLQRHREGDERRRDRERAAARLDAGREHREAERAREERGDPASGALFQPATRADPQHRGHHDIGHRDEDDERSKVDHASQVMRASPRAQ